jgi:mxaC protein
MFFSANPIQVVPFTQHGEVMQAAITAGAVGRGLSDTDVGWALITAIKAFDQRPYSGSRIILLVSDGGAKLDVETQREIQAGMLKNRIALNWIYLRSINGPDFNRPQNDDASSEIVLHRYFQTLQTPYRAYQAQTPEDLAQAIAEVGKQQNFPLDFPEQVPRQDYSRHCLMLAALCCLLLLVHRSMQLRSWA